MVGVINGTITVNTFLIPLQPKLSAASIKAESMLFKAPET